MQPKPQFEEIDLNLDGILDLIVHDKSGNRIIPYINKGTANTIDFEYEGCDHITPVNGGMHL